MSGSQRTDPGADPLLPRVSEIIARTIGLHFPPERSADLQRGLTNAASDLGFDSARSCATWLLTASLTPEQLNTLANHLTIGETYFFREQKTFAALESHVLPQLIGIRSAERRLRIWSAACATGEEPYSLAILLRQVLPQWRDWRITVLATDINESFLRRAATGVYGEWSFRDSAPDLKQRYFTRTTEGRYAILPEIRDAVTFSQLNLVQDSFPSLATDTNAMDLILCRNVLIYFAPQQTRTLVEKLRQCLAPDGWLAVSPSECSHILFSRYATENFPGTILYRKAEDFDATRGNVPSPSPAAPANQPAFLPPAMDAPTYAQEPVARSEDMPSSSATMPISLDNACDAAPSIENCARQLANEGRLAEALLESRRWIEAEKLNPAAHYVHAMVAQELGDAATARRSLQHALYLHPAFVLAHFALGNISRGEGRDTQAGRHFSNALSLLEGIHPLTLVPESDGLTAGRLTEIIGTLLGLPRSAA